MQEVDDEDDIMSERECREVINILDMFRCIKRAIDKIDDKSGIDEYHTKFKGFDGNGNQGFKYMAYADFVCHGPDPRFQELKIPRSFNSHSHMLSFYRLMLIEWEKSKNKYDLGKKDLIRITNVSIQD